MDRDRRVASLQHIRVRLHRLSAVPALLICYAVILNIGPFANAQRSAMTAVAPQAFASAAGRPQANDVTSPERLASNAAPVGAEPATPTPPGPAADGASAPAVTRSITPVPAESAAVSTTVQPVMLTAQQVELPPAPSTPMTPAQASELAVEGIWAPNETACSLRDFRYGWLPTIIDADGARAGDTFCTFRQRKQIASGWRVVASCADSHDHWTAVVRLTVKDHHLIWASSRGRQMYTRCAPDALVTAAR